MGSCWCHPALQQLMSGLGWVGCAQLEMLRPGLVGTYDAFGERFCGQKVQLARGVFDWRCAALPWLSRFLSSSPPDLFGSAGFLLRGC